MMDPSPQCYIPSFEEIGPLILEKRIGEGPWPSWSCDRGAASKLSPPTHRGSTKMALDWPSGFR